MTVISCAQVEIKNEEFCADLYPHGASCNRTLTDSPRRLTADEWDAERGKAMLANSPKICTSLGAFANWKATIEKLCKDTGRCTYEEMQNLVNFFQKLEGLNEQE